MKQATLCFLVKDNNEKLLLAMKKRGFGSGKWNGVGGKFDPQKGDKNLLGTATRETEEEIGIKIKEIEKVAVLSFYFPYRHEWDQEVHVFFIKEWQGEPKELEEMLPKWFKIKEIPYNEMWDDDRFWLPKVLSGKKIKATFIFKKNEIVSQHRIKVIKGFNKNEKI